MVPLPIITAIPGLRSIIMVPDIIRGIMATGMEGIIADAIATVAMPIPIIKRDTK